MIKRIKRGINLPISGSPSPSISEKSTKYVGINAADYNGMKPSFKLNEGDLVAKGDTIFHWKNDEKVGFVSPVSGKLTKILRGAKRALQFIEIESDGESREKEFQSYKGGDLSLYTSEELIDLIAESGLWTSFRTRPFSKLPLTSSKPHAIFVNTMDSNPLAMSPDMFIQDHESAFNDGLDALQKLTDGKVHVSVKVGYRFVIKESENRDINEFLGPHPSGNVGTHIHLIDPVNEKKVSWSIGYQDVVAIGKLIGSGKLFTERWFSLCGPAAKKPRIIKTTLGAKLEEIIAGEIESSETRVVAGSAIYGRAKSDNYPFLGRYLNQVTLLQEERERVFLGWHDAGFNRFSVMRTFLSKLMPGKRFNLGTSTHGSYRAMVPVGAYEKVFPFEMVPTHLLKALYVGDTDYAQALGCLELDEEDLACCTFVDPGKVDYGPKLRQSLEIIEKEG